LRPNRNLQRLYRESGQVERWGVQAVAGVAVGPTINVEVMARALVYTGSIALGTNVLYLTAIAAKKPFIWRS
jgi:hypothetical protein